jgi:tetratricopeptide (TPR) repeat protein
MEAVLVDLLDGRIVPLRRRAPGLPSDLLAIVGKAMAVRPEDRYANAGELAIDLKRFQRGQLVAARRYSAWQRASRWIGKHCAAVAVAAVAAVVVGGIGVAGVTSVVHEKTRAANAEQLALTNRRDAEDLMDFMLVDLHRELESVGKVDLMFGVASRARDYYDRKAIVDRRAILARENLADVLDDQGATRAALDEHLASLALVETFAIAEPASTAWRHDLALAHRKAGYVLYQLGELTASVGEFRASCAAARSAADGDWELEVEEADLGLAGAQRALGDAAGALATARGALVLATDRTRVDPSRRREVMVAENRVGDALRALGDHTGELAAYRAALAIADRLAQVATDGPAQHDLALAYAHVGHALDSLGDRPNARNAFEVAEQLDRMLVLRDPANATWQRDLATAEDALAKL